MSKYECRSTKNERQTRRTGRRFEHWAFVIPSSFMLRKSSFRSFLGRCRGHSGFSGRSGRGCGFLRVMVHLRQQIIRQVAGGLGNLREAVLEKRIKEDRGHGQRDAG